MVLQVAATALTAVISSKYYVHAILTFITVFVFRAFSQGRTTNRERDLHGRVILVTVRARKVNVQYIPINADRKNREHLVP
jgi:hypothetical protein